MIFSTLIFFISMVFIGYSVTLIYLFWSRNNLGDFPQALSLGIFGSLAGGLIEVYVIRPILMVPGYFYGFQYIISLGVSLIVLTTYHFIMKVREN